ncbi:MAG: DNA-processing protein DprA [Candidatus Pacebacteria bacterium]|nr:DNA-processing protein DprA [Candidatus Paceibacterota bacterium]
MEQIPLPYLLKQIPDAPKQLFIRGNFPSGENTVFITIVGSRKFTPYGRQACEYLVRGLRGYPVVIVSGLALGIDTLAHETAIENNITTIAIPGSGLNDAALYPATNRGLAEKIIQSGGCLLSEFEPNFKATNWSFPRRNRIMAGISHALVVIEAENISGTRITARLGTEYNREVFAVPGSIFSAQSEGTNELIREGATPLTSAQDIIDFFGFEKAEGNEQFIALGPDEAKIMEQLTEPLSRNQLAEKLGMSIVTLNILLSSMEIKGLIKENLGKIYRI